MLPELTPAQRDWVDQALANMSDDEKCAHVLCPAVSANTMTENEAKAVFEDCPAGCAFFFFSDGDKIAALARAIQADAKIPILTCMDILWGPGHALKGDSTTFVTTMACGAADDAELTYAMGRSIALEGRAHGIHWTLGPVVDINMNHNSPIVNFRAYGEKPGHVLRHAKAFIAGVQDTGLMAATAKHFPGDGVDDRDQHFMTSVNSLDRAAWDASFGKVYRAVIQQGVAAFMSGHIAFPAADPADGGPLLDGPPASLSKRLLCDLLHDELGFDGVIVSDAINMTGLTCHVSRADLAWRLIDAGNDVVLFSNPAVDFPGIKRALADGQLSRDRLEDAVRRILTLKCRVGIAPEMQTCEVKPEEKAAAEAVAVELGRRSICVVRNEDDVLPMNLAPGSKILTVTIEYPLYDLKFIRVESVDQELRNRGFKVDNILNPGKGEVAEMAKDYDAIFVNINVGAHSRAGIIRIGKNLFGVFEDIAEKVHPRVIVTSFGDPYKLYEMPFIRTYVNTFSPTETSIEAAVKVWFGEAEALGKSPVSLPGIMTCDVAD